MSVRGLRIMLVLFVQCAENVLVLSTDKLLVSC